MDIERLLQGLVLGRHLGVGELEKRQRTAIADAEESVHEGNLPAREVRRLALLDPGGDQRQPDDVFVEMPGPFLVGADIGVVMEPQRQLLQETRTGL